MDTSVWIDHLNQGSSTMAELLRARQVLAHPFVVGEVALGSVRERKAVLAILHDLPKATVAEDHGVLRLIEDWELTGTGIGYMDAHLLASALLTSGSRLWTRDRALRKVAQRLSLDAGLK
ncbi:MAG TPA: type II toxin-antitoxin system VapC family toxin [Acidobacteriaceae bacterium]|nr:type II toxin-antitoxin system VapC family toxin [Acidobacteriaceae bacterium]